jgi:hypothetical protein
MDRLEMVEVEGGQSASFLEYWEGWDHTYPRGEMEKSEEREEERIPTFIS